MASAAYNCHVSVRSTDSGMKLRRNRDPFKLLWNNLLGENTIIDPELLPWIWSLGDGESFHSVDRNISHSIKTGQ